MVRGQRLGDRARHGGTRRQVHHGVGAGEGPVEQRRVEDRALVQLDVEASDVGIEASGQVVDGHDLAGDPLLEQQARQIRTDESGPARDHDFHEPAAYGSRTACQERCAASRMLAGGQLPCTSSSSVPPSPWSRASSDSGHRSRPAWRARRSWCLCWPLPPPSAPPSRRPHPRGGRSSTWSSALGFAVACVLAGAARPGGALWCVAVTAVALLVSSSPVESLGWGVAGAAVAMVAVGSPTLLLGGALGGALGGLAAQVLLRLEWPALTGASLAAGLLAAVPLLALGCTRLPDRARRVTGIAVGTAGLLVVWGGLAGIAAALSARPDVDRGVDLARDGLAALERDDREQASELLSEAAAAFTDARAGMRAWWVRPAFAVPVVAQHARAVDTLAQSGADLGRAAADAVQRADPDTLSTPDGGVDLEAMEALLEPLDSASHALDDAERAIAAIESPWLVAPVADRLASLQERIVTAADGARTAADGVRLAPALLGGDGTRRYFLAIQTPAEARGGGGFMGSWGELVAVNGRLTLARLGRVADLTGGGPDPEARQIDGLEEYQRRYGTFRPERYWGLVNFSTDFPTVAAVIMQLYPQSGGDELDGVIAVDPYGFAALLDLTGPVTVEGWPEPLTQDNAARVLLHEQYVALGDNEERVEFLASSAEAVFTDLTSEALPSPGAITEALGPAVRGRHLQLASARTDEQALFERIGGAGAVAPLVADSVGIVGQNYGGNKIDWFLHRSAAYDITWDPDSGRIDGSLEVTVANDAPPSGLPHAVIGWGGDVSLGQIPVEDGENLSLLTLYSAVPFTELTLDGAPLAAAQEREFGRYAYSALVRVAPGATAVVRAELAGSVPPGDSYRFDPVWQPVVTPDELAIHVSLPDGWEFADSDEAALDGNGAGVDWVLDRDRSLVLDARRTGRSWFERLEHGSSPWSGSLDIGSPIVHTEVIWGGRRI